MPHLTRIVVVGDEGVGKSSLISALISSQEEIIPSVFEHPVPACLGVSDGSDPDTLIFDTECGDEDTESGRRLRARLRDADAVVIVFDVNHPDTCHRIESYWLPLIRSARKLTPSLTSTQTPVVIAANKSDLRSSHHSSTGATVAVVDVDAAAAPHHPPSSPGSTRTTTSSSSSTTSTHSISASSPTDFDVRFDGLLDRNREIEACFTCSARQALYVKDLFALAMKSVVFPTGVLFDSKTGRMTPSCLAALRRIFKILDRDNDGALCDEELAAFQAISYEREKTMSTEEAEAVRRNVKRAQPDGVDDRGLTLPGFLHLHHKFCQKGKTECTWRLLYYFGYDTALTLREEFLCPEMVVRPGERVEVSGPGIRFFEELFRVNDRDGDGALCKEELEDLFSTTPGIPWPNPPSHSHTNPSGNLSLRGFLSQWRMLALQDPRMVLRYLAFLGFRGDTRQAVISLPLTARSVFSCFIFGSRGSGKTTFLRALLQKEFSPEYESTSANVTVCNSIDGSQYHLVLTEFANEDDIVHDSEAMRRCDVACFLHDRHYPTSFSHVSRLHAHLIRHYPNIPCLHFATKADLPSVTQISPRTPQQFLADNGLPTAITQVHFKPDATSSSSSVFAVIAAAAANPLPYRAKKMTIGWSVNHLIRRPVAWSLSRWRNVLAISLVIALGAIGIPSLTRWILRRCRGVSSVNAACDSSLSFLWPTCVGLSRIFGFGSAGSSTSPSTPSSSSVPSVLDQHLGGGDS